MDLMWNYKLDAARQLLEPWRRTEPWHACAYAECAALRVVLTGRRSEAAAALELVRAAEALSQDHGGHGAAQQVLCAELLLLRSGLQVVLGARLRAAFNLRQCWCAYRRLERHLACEDAVAACRGACAKAREGGVLLAEDLRGRVCFGLGFFYLATSLLPVGLCQLARLAGFVMHRHQGKAYLAECAERDLGPRATLAAILLAAYHLDIEPDVRRAGDLLVASLGRQPENVLLHWAGSLLAWRNTCIVQAVQMTGKALWCCGEELSNQAIYLRYELGMFHFMAMDWPEARLHLQYVHDAVFTEKIFFPYRTIVTAQIAAVAFSMGLDKEGEALCRECAAMQDPLSTLRLESDFSEVLQLFLKQRATGRQLLAFEVMYLLRQLPKVPASMLLDIREQLRQAERPWVVAGLRAAAWAAPAPPLGPEVEGLVEHVSAQVLQCVVLFYLGDLEQAMAFVPELSRLCMCLPPWCTYLSAHGLYWCGRLLSLTAQMTDALRCLRQAKALKKYPFNISTKVCKVLEELEAPSK